MTDATVVTPRDRFHAVAAEAPPAARVPVEVQTEVGDPYAAYRRARRERDGAFLETTGGQSGWGYFGVDPVDGLTVSGDAVLAENWENEDSRVSGNRSVTLAAVDGLLAGATVAHADDVVHGKPSQVNHDGEGVFAGLPEGIRVGRYHSLAVERSAIPDCLVETASTDDERDVVMAVRHTQKPHVGVQFHPESILTEHGKPMVQNFLATCRRWER